MQKNLEIQEGRQEQWKPTSTPWIFFSFSQNFPMNIQNDSLLFFLMPCSYFQKNECKKNLDIREGTLKQWKPTSTQRFWQSSKKSEHEGKKSDSVKKAVQGKKSDFSKKKVKNREKNKMTNFPTKNQKQVAFFTGRFFYPALLAALFIPYCKSPIISEHQIIAHQILARSKF
jgi:hypothetical protein